MAGARTQGVGRGVNWGAFGSMGQQYAQIGRTIESGGEALGKGIGGGLAAIGGAIERKKVRDQEASERQKERDYRAGRDKVMDARYEESNREQNQLFVHNLFQESMLSEYAQGRGYKADMEKAAAKQQNLGALIETHLKLYETTGDPKSLEIVRRAAEASAPAAGIALPGVSDEAAVAGAGGVDPEQIAKSNLSRDMGAGVLEAPGINPTEIGIGGIQGRLLSESRLARDKELIEQNMLRLQRMGKPKGFLEMKIREREMHLLGTAYAEVAGREKALGLAKDQSKGMATQEAERRKQVAEEAKQARLDAAADRAEKYLGLAEQRGARADEDQAAQRKAQQAKEAADQAKAEAEQVKRRDAMLKTRKAVLDEAALPLPSDPRDEGMTAADIKNLKTSRIDSMDTSQIALAFTDNVTDEQAKALAGALLRRHGDARVAAQVAYDALPEEEQTQEASLRILNALSLDANGNPKSGK